MNELTYQSLLSQSLNIEFERIGLPAKSYYGNQFKNSEGKKWNKKPDLIISHNLDITLPSSKETALKSPIGIEFKLGTQFSQITKGVIDQIKGSYSKEEFFLEEHKEEKFKLGSLAFATTTSCSEGKIYSVNYPVASNFFIERFCWRANVAVLFKEKEFYWSFKNYRFDLSGKPIARFGKSGELMKYD